MRVANPSFVHGDKIPCSILHETQLVRISASYSRNKMTSIFKVLSREFCSSRLLSPRYNREIDLISFLWTTLCTVLEKTCAAMHTQEGTCPLFTSDHTDISLSRMAKYIAKSLFSGLIGSLSTRVFETRTITGNELFSLLTCPHTTTLTLLGILSPLEASSIHIWWTMLS